jgi:hypothetical protein
MKKYTIILFFLIIQVLALSARDNPSVVIGFHLLAGGRYDDVRMCVGSPKGVKGGPIMDVYVDIRFPLTDNDFLTLNIPVMRPILFGAAFKMLQFEPQLTYEHRFDNGDKPGLVLGAGLGVVFHYGPDYNSSPENTGPSFFAMGPLISGSAGILLEGKSGNWIPGLKAFYSPLFSPDYRTGHIFGGGLELHYEF